jgi:hypothetical protein
MSKLCTGALAGLFVAMAFGTANAAPVCTPTGYVRDSIDLTAKLINPGTVSGQDVDATGCDIGVYYGPGETGAVELGSNIHGARYFGVLTNGALVSVTDSVIHDIGQVPFAGGNFGYGIGCAVDSPQASGGVIHGNTIYNYQKSGIDLRGTNCSGTAGNPIKIVGNLITGKGPTSQIAQNGIVTIGLSFVGISDNNIGGHVYTGSQPAASAGLNILGGPCFSQPNQKNTTLQNNHLFNNDVGIYLLNFNNSCENTAGGASNKNVIIENDIFSFAVLNTSGNGDGPYQVGISITDNQTALTSNNICGVGYDPASGSEGSLVDLIDPAGSFKLKLKTNKCIQNPNNVNADGKAKIASSTAVADSAALSAASGGKKRQARP